MPRATRPRRRNFNITGHAHVLTFSCFHGFKFLRAERTCQWLAGAIAAAQNKHEFDLWAYVFMPEHAHLIIHPKREAYDIARIRHAIKHPVGEIAIRHLEAFAPDGFRASRAGAVRKPSASSGKPAAATIATSRLPRHSFKRSTTST
ncbi:MAG: hypothetical protein U0805_15665 [Pirellulales bacterium]